MNVKPEIDMVAGLSAEIRPLLGGYPPEVQGAVLADLLAMWLAGHRARDESKTAPMRAALLHMHIKAVTQLVAMEDGSN